MKSTLSVLSIFLGLFLIHNPTLAQETEPEIDVEESAEVFLEEYSDAFQESFFEALKQKGIENYDKAINLLLECKRLDSGNRVVDHELAKVYLEDKQYPLAEDYALTALNSEPENRWYLDTLVEIAQKQGSSLDELSSKVPYANSKLKENLALIYYKRANYNDALKVLKQIKESSFSEELSSKINDSIEKLETKSKSVSFSATVNNNGTNDAEQYKMRIKGLLSTNSLPLLLQLSNEALETYPSQPYFYYANGYALNRNAKHREAVEVLETSLDYLVGDISLANKIYKELSDAYNALNNSVKANMYLRKIKPGF
ncbi:hypothetical protein FK220_007260 [Flavobacteriaceae bacterium TP-CH-4]|uniref:Tetratricopeptide repeat protein n=1 Tax=Pelagihabitans pacificus TaxID=2696054 RepID=A0A967E571_9FLAO|nr:hypothetical protein [Pelagihabitans pacificus]NHF59132.1 hypothetical protein [Pelagihabitans pacificus]